MHRLRKRGERRRRRKKMRRKRKERKEKRKKKKRQRNKEKKKEKQEEKEKKKERSHTGVYEKPVWRSITWKHFSVPVCISCNTSITSQLGDAASHQRQSLEGGPLSHLHEFIEQQKVSASTGGLCCIQSWHESLCANRSVLPWIIDIQTVSCDCSAASVPE